MAFLSEFIILNAFNRDSGIRQLAILNLSESSYGETKGVQPGI